MREVIVIGAGVVGVSLAHALTAQAGFDVIVLERDARESRGSTAYAPGFVGLYNDAPVLTNLARESAAIYDRAGSGFRRSGGVELATSKTGLAELQRRVDAARSVGLPAELLAAADLPAAVTTFVDAERLVAAAHFLDDGSAEVNRLVHSLRQEAVSRGAQFRNGQEVAGVDEGASGATVVTASGDQFTADAVVLAAGVWGPSLARSMGIELPLFPVAHPYVYDAPRSSWNLGSFVRWPEHHVYARIHHDRLGIGSYDHHPVGIEQDALDAGAGLKWSECFTPAIESAQMLLRPEARFVPDRRVNGVFAMTPDNLPLLGRHPAMHRVWIAEALWVTHAAGAAARLAASLVAGAELPEELRIDRFDGAESAALRSQALRLYRDIYASDAESE